MAQDERESTRLPRNCRIHVIRSKTQRTATMAFRIPHGRKAPVVRNRR